MPPGEVCRPSCRRGTRRGAWGGLLEALGAHRRRLGVGQAARRTARWRRRVAQPVCRHPDSHRGLPRLGHPGPVLLGRAEPDAADGRDERLRAPERQDLPRGAARAQPALHLRSRRFGRRCARPVLAALRADGAVRRGLDEARRQHRARGCDRGRDARRVVLRLAAAHSRRSRGWQSCCRSSPSSHGSAGRFRHRCGRCGRRRVQSASRCSAGSRSCHRRSPGRAGQLDGGGVGRVRRRDDRCVDGCLRPHRHQPALPRRADPFRW